MIPLNGTVWLWAVAAGASEVAGDLGTHSPATATDWIALAARASVAAMVAALAHLMPTTRDSQNAAFAASTFNVAAAPLQGEKAVASHPIM